MTANPGNHASPARCPDVTWPQGLALVASHLQHIVDRGYYAAVTVDKMLAEMGLLPGFMTDGMSKPVVAHATQAEIQQWLGSALARNRKRGAAPSPTTVRIRITSTRMFFKVLSRLNFDLPDPTAGMHGPGRQVRKSRPATDDELLLVRYTTETVCDHAWAAAVALTEATAATSELSHIFVSDVDLTNETAQMPGGKRSRARTGHLSKWGAHQLALRIKYLRQTNPGVADKDLSITYTGSVGGDSADVAAAKLMNRILTTAGLQGEHGIKPGSIRAAFGLRIWQQHQDLGLVAHALGCKTFDAAANQIGITVDDLPENAVTSLQAAVLNAKSTTAINAVRGATRTGRATQ